MKSIRPVEHFLDLSPKLVKLILAATALPLASYGQTSLSLPATTLTANTTLYQAPATIINTSTFVVQSSASVTFIAGTSITLMPGFDAKAGSAPITFHAVINTTTPPTGVSITTEGAPPTNPPTKEYIRVNGKVVAIENSPN